MLNSDTNPDGMESVWFKPLQRLFNDGAPVSPVGVLYYIFPDGTHLPFATISKTKKDRLILWPAIPASTIGESRAGDAIKIDHFTLELRSGKTHITAFEQDGIARSHFSPGWKLHEVHDGVHLWAILASRIDLLRKQVGSFEVRVKLNKNDSARREAEFVRFAASTKKYAVQAPKPRGNGILSAIFIVKDSKALSNEVATSIFPKGDYLDHFFPDWPNGDNFGIANFTQSFAGTELLIQTASPIGEPIADIVIGWLRES